MCGGSDGGVVIEVDTRWVEMDMVVLVIDVVVMTWQCCRYKCVKKMHKKDA